MFQLLQHPRHVGGRRADELADVDGAERHVDGRPRLRRPACVSSSISSSIATRPARSRRAAIAPRRWDSRSCLRHAAQHVNLKPGVASQHRGQRFDGEPVHLQGCHRFDGVHIAAEPRQAHQIVRQQKRDDAWRDPPGIRRDERATPSLMLKTASARSPRSKTSACRGTRNSVRNCQQVFSRSRAVSRVSARQETARPASRAGGLPGGFHRSLQQPILASARDPVPECDARRRFHRHALDRSAIRVPSCRSSWRDGPCHGATKRRGRPATSMARADVICELRPQFLVTTPGIRIAALGILRCSLPHSASASCRTREPKAWVPSTRLPATCAPPPAAAAAG